MSKLGLSTAIKGAVERTFSAPSSDPGLAIDIVGDRFFLDASYKGAADINTREKFLLLYGLRDGVSDATITAIYKVFHAPAPFTDNVTKEKLATLSAKELVEMKAAIQTRIHTLTMTINSLVNGTVIQEVAKYKRNRMNQVLSWITDTLGARASGIAATQIGPAITMPTRYKQLLDDKRDAGRKHKYMFDSIMAIAYYLANPDYLIDSTDASFADKQAIVDRFEAVLELLDRGHLHDLVSSIQQDRGLPVDLSGVDAMNYFERIRLKNVLDASSNIDASQVVLDEIKLPSMDKIMSNRVVSMLKLFQAQKYIDASSVEIVDRAIRDKKRGVLDDVLGKVVTDLSGSVRGFDSKAREVIVGLRDSFKPVYEFYRRVYDPVFSFLETRVVGDDPEKWPLDDMEKILRLGIDKYKQKDISSNVGVYKLIDASSGLIDFIMKLQGETRFSGPSMTPVLQRAFSSLPSEILGDLIGERPEPGKFPAKTPLIRYLLRNQFNVPQTLDDDELEQKLLAYRSPIIAPAPAAAAAKKPVIKIKKPTIGTVRTGGGPDEFRELQTFLSSEGVYMFVNHRTGVHKNLNPQVFDVSNNVFLAAKPELAHYRTLKQGDVITEPSPRSYVPMNIVILALSCMIIFYKRLEKLAR